MSSPTFARSTLNRAVHLLITPRPSNIGESREVLRLISQFGNVEHFKSLKYDTLSAPRAAIVIFQHEEAATACLKRSPIRFRLGPATEAEQQAEEEERRPGAANPVAAKPAPPVQDPRAPSGAFGLGPTTHTRSLSTASSSASASLPSPPRKDPPMPFLGSQPSSPWPPPQSRIFQIQTNPARKNFRDHIDHSHHHGYFALDTKSPIQADLAKRVPISGLSDWDWRKEDKLWRIGDAERRKDRQGRGRRRSLGEIYAEGNGRGGEGMNADGQGEGRRRSPGEVYAEGNERRGEERNADGQGWGPRRSLKDFCEEENNRGGEERDAQINAKEENRSGLTDAELSAGFTTWKP